MKPTARKTIEFALCVFLSLVFLHGFILLYAQEKPLRVVLDHDYPPFTYFDEEGNLSGILVDFWKLWEERTGIAVELIPVEWAKAHEMMHNKEAEVIDTVFYTEERAQYLDYTQATFSITSSLYYAEILGPMNSLENFTPYLIGAKEKDALIDIAKTSNPNLSFRLYKNYADIVEAAKRKEIEAFLMDDPPANYYLVQHGLLHHFRRLPLPTTNAFHLATWKGNTKVLALLNKGLAQFSSQELEGLLSQYLVKVERIPSWLFPLLLLGGTGMAILLSIFFLFTSFLKKRVREATNSLSLANQALEAMQQKLLQTISTVAKLSLTEMTEEEFLPDVLDLALKVISKARYGSAILLGIEGGRIVAVQGHSESLVGFVFHPEDLLSSNDVVIIKDILHYKSSFSTPEQHRTLLDLCQPITETLIVPLRWENEAFGQIMLDISPQDHTHFDEGDCELMRHFASICAAFHAIRKYAQREGTLLEKLLLTLVHALHYYDQYTKGHSETSAQYALEIGRRLNLDTKTLRRLYWAALIHDVGKIFIPQEILRKPASLTLEKYALVKLHPVKGEALLSGVKDLEEIAKIVRHHHEHFDGSGYPDGLKGEEIPLESRIVAVVDAFEAMISERPYRKSFSLQEAIHELKRCSGTQSDPTITQIMIAIIEE